MENKRIIVSGATGYVGRFIVEQLLSSGHQVLVLGRKPPSENFFSKTVDFEAMSLSQPDINPEVFRGYDALVHAAFHHIPGRYRGGEGQEPEKFNQLNHFGSMQLFEAAKSAGVQKALFLSSRAVYGKQTAGASLFETTEPHPDTVYGATKLQTERALSALAGNQFLPIIIRATGVYGPSSPSSKHKWHELFEEFSSGKNIPSRAGTEVHGADLAKAVELLLNAQPAALTECADGENAPIFNISDILLDRQELLKTYSILTNCKSGKLPTLTDVANYNSMDCTRLKSLGWKPREHLDLSGLAPA